jgi:hypothetical protein
MGKKKKKRSSFGKKSKRKLASLVFSGLIVIGLIFFAWLLRIKTIKCLVSEESEPQFCQKLSFLEEESLFFTNLEQTDLYKINLSSDQGLVYIPVQAEAPWYLLHWADKQYLVNSLHQLTAVTTPDTKLNSDLIEIELAIIYENKIDEKNQQLDAQLNKQNYDLIQALARHEVKYQRLVIDGSQSYLLDNDIKYIFEFELGDFNKLAIKAKIIQGNLTVIEQDPRSTQDIEVIDLRFDLPIVNPQ